MHIPGPGVNTTHNPESVQYGVLAVWTAAMAMGMAAPEAPEEPATSVARLLLVQCDVSDQLGLRSSLGGAQGGRRCRRHYRIPGTYLILSHLLGCLNLSNKIYCIIPVSISIQVLNFHFILFIQRI